LPKFDVVVDFTMPWLRDPGARPFVLPAMSSHGGGTSEMEDFAVWALVRRDPHTSHLDATSS
jgi:hypothetical protein